MGRGFKRPTRSLHLRCSTSPTYFWRVPPVSQPVRVTRRTPSMAKRCPAFSGATFCQKWYTRFYPEHSQVLFCFVDLASCHAYNGPAYQWFPTRSSSDEKPKCHKMSNGITCIVHRKQLTEILGVRGDIPRNSGVQNEINENALPSPAGRSQRTRDVSIESSNHFAGETTKMYNRVPVNVVFPRFFTLCAAWISCTRQLRYS